MREIRRDASPYIRLVSGAEPDCFAVARVLGAVADFREQPWRARPANAVAPVSRFHACASACAHRRERRRFGARRLSGFTIIEVMIVVVIIAILGLIAYPSYVDHLRKGSRSAATSFLSDVATRQQQYLLDARQYAVGAGALASLSMTVPQEVSQFYTVSINPAAPTLPPSFTIVATPIAGSRQVPDGALTLDSTGARTRNGQPGWK